MPEERSSTVADSTRKDDKRSKMLELLDRGLLKPGQEIFFQYKRDRYVANIEVDGRLLAGDGENFDTPSEFVNEMVRRYNTENRIRLRGTVNLNGWQTCSFDNQTLQQLLDSPDPSDEGAAEGSRNSEDVITNGERKRKQDAVDREEDAALYNRRRRTTRLAAGKIKQVDYKFPPGQSTDGVTTTATRIEKSIDFENDKEANTNEDADQFPEDHDVFSSKELEDDADDATHVERVTNPVASGGEGDSHDNLSGSSLEGGSSNRSEQLADCEMEGSSSGWDLEEQEMLLECLQSKGVLDPEVLTEDSLGRDSEDTKKYLDLLTMRMKEAGVQTSGDVKAVTAFISAEVYMGRAAKQVINDKKAQRKGKASRELSGLKRQLEQERNKINDLLKLQKKRNREVEEGRSKLESEMQARREIELDRSKLKLQCKDSQTEEIRERELCTGLQNECDLLKEKEAHARNKLEESRGVISSLKAILEGAQLDVRMSPVFSSMDENDFARPNPQPGRTGSFDRVRNGAVNNFNNPPSLGERASAEPDARLPEGLGPRILAESRGSEIARNWIRIESGDARTEQAVDKLQLDMRRYRTLAADIDVEIDEWRGHLDTGMRQTQYLVACKARLEQVKRNISANPTPKKAPVSGSAAQGLQASAASKGSRAKKRGSSGLASGSSGNRQGGGQVKKSGPALKNSNLKSGTATSHKNDAKAEATRRKPKDVLRSIPVL
ncbi:hypothetical protein NDN08_000289 [Rhodosorus marinus]|uniref:RAMA domain-containing protein n=1 Tax=Rhodosorus marinus TaxID=101924 RepID=A0AAV8UMH3_9RHOD|nr:hypothetical protein NDN08_000289 [Rhodosorus marinus]